YLFVSRHFASAVDLSYSFLYLLSALRSPPSPTLFPYTTLFRSRAAARRAAAAGRGEVREQWVHEDARTGRSPAGRSRERRLSHRSEEHTSELQSRFDLVCRLLLEKKNGNQ